MAQHLYERTPRFFDAYLIVDWSANSKPKTGKDSIWYFLLRRTLGGEQVVGPHNPRTRHLAQAALTEILEQQAGIGQRTLVGFDFPYAYPKGFASALGLSGPPWRAVWDELKNLIHDEEDNCNNRFEVVSDLNKRLSGGPGPFWACPRSKETGYLSSKKTHPPRHPLC